MQKVTDTTVKRMVVGSNEKRGTKRLVMMVNIGEKRRMASVLRPTILMIWMSLFGR